MQKAPVQVRPGDWECRSCGRHVYGSRVECKCGQPRAMNAAPMAAPAFAAGVTAGARPGDWPCSACGAIVYASRAQCFRCQTPKPMGGAQCGGYGGGCAFGAPSFAARNGGWMPGHPSGFGFDRRADSRRNHVRQGDWTCPACSRHVYGCRSECKCGQPRPGGNGPDGAPAMSCGAAPSVNGDGGFSACHAAAPATSFAGACIDGSGGGVCSIGGGMPAGMAAGMASMAGMGGAMAGAMGGGGMGGGGGVCGLMGGGGMQHAGGGMGNSSCFGSFGGGGFGGFGGNTFAPPRTGFGSGGGGMKPMQHEVPPDLPRPSGADRRDPGGSAQPPRLRSPRACMPLAGRCGRATGPARAATDTSTPPAKRASAASPGPIRRRR